MISESPQKAVISEPSFFEHVFRCSRDSTLPEAALYALKVFPAALIAYGLEWTGGAHGIQILDVQLLEASMLIPISTLVMLMVSVRIQEAYSKWIRANLVMSRISAISMQILQRVASHIPRAQRVESSRKEQLHRLHRHLVVASFLTMQLVRGSRDDIDRLHDVYHLLTEKELRIIRCDVTTISSLDGKKDTFPSRARPSLCLFWLHENIAECCFPPPVHFGLGTLVSELNDLIVEAEHIAFHRVPSRYAQVIRLVIFVFLLLIPFALVSHVGILVLPLAFLSNVIYFALELCAEEMEYPFGDDNLDVDLEKLVRRADKHLASILSVAMGDACPVLNYDLFPEARSTNREGGVIELRLDRHDRRQFTLDRELSSSSKGGESGGGSGGRPARKGEEKQDAQDIGKKQETETSGSMNSMDEQGITSLTWVRRGEHQVHELM